MARYELLAGLHQEAVGTPAKGVEGAPGYVPASPDYKETVYDAKKRNGRSNIIESDKDLVAKFGAEKFRKLGDDDKPRRSKSSTVGGGKSGEVVGNEPHLEDADEEDNLEGGDEETSEDVTTSEDGYEEMTVEELREHAEASEIDLTGAHRKADIIKAIRKSEA